MHICNCQVAIKGDALNKAAKMGVTVPEIALLRVIHGFDAVTDIKITGNEKRQQLEELGRLKMRYPKYQEKAQELWRDWGGRLPTHITDLGLRPEFFEVERPADFTLADEFESPPDGDAPAAEVKAKGKKAERKPSVAELADADNFEVTKGGTLAFND